MHRLVIDRWGTVWEVRTRVAWFGRPRLEFEVDETSRRAAVTVGSVLGLLTLLLVVSVPTDLLFPSWAAGPLLVALGLGGAWWLTHREVVVDVAPLHPEDGPVPWSAVATGAWRGWRLHNAVVGSLVRAGRPDPAARGS